MEKTKLEWYEKKRGIKLQDKIRIQDEKEKFFQKHKENAERKINSERKSNGEAGHRKNFRKSDKLDRAIKPLDVLNELLGHDGIPSDAVKLLADFQKIVERTHPLNSKQKALLPQQIRDLSHNLTDERSLRRLSYMNEKVKATAYVHYYLWWNLVRLTRLFSNMDSSFFALDDGDICLDIGSGPLTIPIALYLARPELRKKHISWYCMDISQQIISFGEDIFYSVAANLESESWKITRVKGEFGTSVKEKAALITSGNVFNELHDDADMPPDFLAKKYVDKILSYAERGSGKTKILVVEPGDPRSARLVSLMRDSFIRKNFSIVSPCPHASECPMQGKKGGKWCNFAFTTETAPDALKKLSEKADLAKERAVLSFVAASESAIEKKPVEGKVFARITSDRIKIPGKTGGYYACSEKGLLLIITNQNLASGALLKVSIPENPKIDEKSGALVV